MAPKSKSTLTIIAVVALMALRSLIYREGTIAFGMESMAIWAPYPSLCFTHSGLLWQVIMPYLDHYATESLDLHIDPGFQRSA